MANRLSKENTTHLEKKNSWYSPQVQAEQQPQPHHQDLQRPPPLPIFKKSVDIKICNKKLNVTSKI